MKATWDVYMCLILPGMLTKHDKYLILSRSFPGNGDTKSLSRP